MERGTDKEESLTAAEAAGYRALVARANCLGSDRVDFQKSVQELCGSMSTPTKADVHKLRKLKRHLAGRPRLVLEFKFKGACEDQNGDSEEERRCLRTAPAALQEGELEGIACHQELGGNAEECDTKLGKAELVAAARMNTELLGLCQLCHEIQMPASGIVHVDSTAALGVSQR